MQTWLSLASDRPGDACLKQYGSVDEFCRRQQRLLSSQPAKTSTGDGGAGGGGADGGDSAGCREGKSRGRGAVNAHGSGEGRGLRPVRDNGASQTVQSPGCAN